MSVQPSPPLPTEDPTGSWLLSCPDCPVSKRFLKRSSAVHAQVTHECHRCHRMMALRNDPEGAETPTIQQQLVTDGGMDMPPKEESVPSPSQQTTDRPEAVCAADSIPDYANLKPRALPRVGRYAVLHKKPSTKANTTWIVDLNGDYPTCTCPDMKYNKDTGQGCKHIETVLYDAVGTTPEVDLLVLDQIARYDSRVETAVNKLERAATAQEAEAANAQARPAGEGVPTTQTNGGATGNGVDADEAAEKLQEAFDNVLDGMRTKVHSGKVWVNKTPDAPETLPGPGNVEVFTALLREPEQVFYEPDDGPGDYFVNSIRPENVGEYISEVLE